MGYFLHKKKKYEQLYFMAALAEKRIYSYYISKHFLDLRIYFSSSDAKGN